MSNPIIKHNDATHGSLRSYIVGFVLSLGLTLAAYLMVQHGTFSRGALVAAVVAMALVQFAVQLLFFLHLGQESGPRMRLWGLVFMISVVGILVFGSLWIMNNLNYGMQHMNPNESSKYLHDHEGL